MRETCFVLWVKQVRGQTWKGTVLSGLCKDQYSTVLSFSTVEAGQGSQMQRDGKIYLVYSKSSVSDGAKWINNDAGAEDPLLEAQNIKRQFHKSYSTLDMVRNCEIPFTIAHWHFSERQKGQAVRWRASKSPDWKNKSLPEETEISGTVLHAVK